MTEPGQPGFAGEPDTLAPRLVGDTADDQSDNAAAGSAPPAAADEDLSAKAARLQDELTAVRAQASGQDTVRLKVEEPHVAFVHNGLTVGEDFTEVPSHAVQAMMEAAANSGVMLTQEEV